MAFWINITYAAGTFGATVSTLDIFSNYDSYATAVESGIAKATLVSGYSLSVPDGTTVVRVKGTGTCAAIYQDISVTGAPTPAPTPTPAAPTPTPAAPTPTPAAPTPTPAAPPPVSSLDWDCIDGVCTNVGAGLGIYADEMECTPYCFGIGPTPTPAAPTPTPAAPTPAPTPSFTTYNIGQDHANNTQSCTSFAMDFHTEVYAAESLPGTVTRFYTDTALTVGFVGSSDFYSWAVAPESTNATSTGQVSSLGNVSNITGCSGI